MGKSNGNRARTSNATLVLELQAFKSGTKQGIEVVLSFAGREGTLRREWVSPSGALVAPQEDDLIFWCLQALRSHLHGLHGVQETMEFDRL